MFSSHFRKIKEIEFFFYIIIAQILFILHFSLLHAWTGAAMNAIAAIRTVIFYQKDTKDWAKNTIWVFVFMIAFILAGVATWTNYSSLLPIIAMLTDTFAIWKESAKSIRFLMLVPRPFWFSYNFIVGSYAGMTTEVFILLSIIIGIVRFDILKTKKIVRLSSRN